MRRAVIASASPYRRGVYQAAVEGLGCQAVLVERAIDCVAWLRQQQPDLLVVESSLPWGGCDGVLEVAQTELALRCPVIVVAVGGRPTDWLSLSRFRIDDFLPRFPGLEVLRQLLAQNLGLPASDGGGVAATARCATPVVPAPYTGNLGKSSEKRHLPEGSGLSSALLRQTIPAPQLLAADSGMSVSGGSALSDAPKTG